MRIYGGSDHVGPLLHEELNGDPRLSSAQREGLVRACAADRDATCEGLDTKLRPVIRASLHKRQVRYALLRNGDPVPVEGRITEVW